MRKVVLLLLAASCWFGKAQQNRQISFSQLSVNDGLSQNSVVDIAQDSTGYLWFATQDGLNRYDGKQFHYYPKLFEDVTRDRYSKLGKIYVDDTDQLVIISEGGLLEFYNAKTDSFQPTPLPFEVATYFKDQHGAIWMGSYGSGLYRFTSEDQLPEQMLGSILSTSDIYALGNYQQQLLVLSSSGVFMLDASSGQHKQWVNPSQSEPLGYSSFALGMDNTLWLGSFGKGLFFLEEESQTLTQFMGFSEGHRLPTNLNIETLLMDSRGRLWIGTYGDGAYLVEFFSQTITHFMADQFNPKAIHYNDVLDIFEDYTGTVWLGTDGAGLSYYDENLFKFNGLTNRQVPVFANIDVTRSITMDAEGAIWLGTSGKGLTRYEPSVQKFASYKHNDKDPYSIKSDRVMSLSSSGNTIWIGFQDEGLSLLDDDQFQVFSPNSTPALDITTVWWMMDHSPTSKWLGTQENGLILFDQNRGILKQYSNDGTDQSLSGNTVRAIAQDDEQNLWVGTEANGLNKIEMSTDRVTQLDFPSLKSIKSLLVQKEIVWIGTNGNGLHAYDTTTNQLYSYSTDDGLPNNVIYGILPTEDGTLWVSTNRGVASIAVDGLGAPPQIAAFDTYDGLQASEFNTGAYYKSSDGTLYFGGIYGINWFNPGTLTQNPVPPKTILSSIEVFNDPISVLRDTEFNARQNTFTFSFAALHFSQPERNQYKYQLVNYDSDWSVPSTEDYARYTNLPPGDYRFEVLASNYDGVWTSQPASFSFTINPPWYLTLWAKIAYVLLAITALLLVYRYLKWRWRMELELQLEHEETERLKKLDELKSNLYTNISHEFRTPLTLISGPVRQLLSKEDLEASDQQTLELIEGSSERMLQLVNQLLDLAKLEDGHVVLQVTQHELTPHLTQLVAQFNHAATAKKMTLETDIDCQSPTWYDKDAMEKIVTNLLSNAIKYSPEGSTIQVKARVIEGNLKFTVVNDNETLTNKELSQLFDRFYQADGNAEGVGIGLSLIKELCVLCRGQISAWKPTPATLCFEVVLPVQSAEYKPTHISITEDFEPSEPEEAASVELPQESQEEAPIVLIVEDHTDVRNYLISLFDSKYQIVTAEDGQQGIALAKKHVPDIIISDIMMPGVDGIELCNTVKQETSTSHIPVILLTAKVGDRNELEGLKNKADDYITKPFHTEILQQKVANLLAARQAWAKRFDPTQSLKPKEIAITDLDEKLLEQIQTLIDTRFSDPEYKASDFATDVGLSRMQLHRKLKALTGQTTTEFIRSQRLKSAVHLLSTSSLNVAEVGYTVGFNTPSYFIKCFKEVYHCTPSEYAASTTK